MDTQAGRQPGQGRMAASAVQAKLTKMNGRLFVAARAVTGRTRHDGRRMASLASLIRMPAVQWKDGLMIKADHRVVTVVTVLAPLAI